MPRLIPIGTAPYTMLRISIASCRWWLLPPAPLTRTLSCCAVAADPALELVPAHAGTDKEYQHHILLQLPRPLAATGEAAEATAAAAAGGAPAAGAWWPDLVER